MTSTIDRPDTIEAAPATRSYRYPGSPPFRDQEVDRLLFKGRDHESRTVLHSILSSELFLLYAVSGLGKSSLLNAGVMQELRDRGYWPVSVRLNDPRVPPAVAIESQIIDAAAKDPAIDLDRTPGYVTDPEDTPHLWDVLGSVEVWRGNRLEHLVVVLDQFEELFTLEWPDEIRRRFIAEFGEVVRHSRADADPDQDTDVDGRTGNGTAPDGHAPLVPPPAVKFVLVVREDALGELEALSDDVPQVLQHRFRLGPLDPDQALAAIREPALVADEHLVTQRFAYSEEAAQQILHFLQHTERASATTIAEANRSRSSVDPSQLQIICQYVERRVLPTKPARSTDGVIEIEAADLGGLDGLRSILGDFYRRTVESFPDAEQKKIRELCEKGLISQSERRLSLESEAIVGTFGVQPHVLDELVDHRLVRAEPRVGSVYYELAHDTLVQPILKDRLERQRARARKRVRWIAIAVGIAAFVAAVVALVFAVNAVSDSDDAAEGTDGDGAQPEPTAPPTTEPPSPPIAIGSVELGEISEAGAVASFRLEPASEPLAVLVRARPGSENLNLAVAVTSPSGARRSQDQLGAGSPETIIVPATDVPAGSESTTEVSISSNDGSTGLFDVIVESAQVVSLDAAAQGSPTGGDEPGSRMAGVIGEPGGVAVYAVEADSSIAFDVSPGDGQSSSGGSQDKGLDSIVEIIDPSGVGRIVDAGGPGEPETTTIRGDEGQTLVVVRGYQSSVGDFEATAQAVDRIVLSVGDALRDQVVEGGQPLEYAVQVRTPVAVLVTPTDDFDARLEIAGPDGASRVIDGGSAGAIEVADLAERGEHVIRVTSFAETTGGFAISAIPVVPIGSEGDDLPVALPAALDVGDDLGDVTSLRVTADDPEEVLAIQIRDSGGFVLTDLRAESAGDAVSAIVDTAIGSPGARLLLVTSDDGAGGGTVTRWSTDSAPLDLDSSSDVTEAPVAFDVTSAIGDLVVVTATPQDPADVVTLRVNSNAGFTVNQASSAVAGDPVSVVVINDASTAVGDLRIVAASALGNAEIDLDLTLVEPVEVGLDQPLDEEFTAPSVIDLATIQTDLLVVSAQPGDPSEMLTLEGLDADGFRTAFAQSPTAGQPATLVITDDGFGVGLGVQRVVITSNRTPGSFRLELSERIGEPLVVDGPSVTARAPAVLGFDPPNSPLVVVRLQPLAPDDIIEARITGEVFGRLVEARSPSPGVPVAVLLDPPDFADGLLDLIVNPGGGVADVDAAVETVVPVPLRPDGRVTLESGPAIFEIDVNDDESWTFVAQSDASSSFLTAQAYSPRGVLLDTPAVYQPLPTVEQLPAEVIELFPQEVRDLFADGLPATVEEAIAQLNEADLLDEVTSVLNQNDVAVDALLGGSAASTAPARVSLDVGSSGSGRYRVLVTSVDPDAEITVELVPPLIGEPISAPADAVVGSGPVAPPGEGG
ncbi:MAG: hypothetical protein AAGD33_00690 [Actinomycetota bacterium]